MKLYRLVALAFALLAGCGSDPAPVAPPSGQAASDGPPAKPVAGPERRILAVGDSLFAGYGLAPGQGYPQRLEAALRARGVNARIATAAVSGDTSADVRARIDFALNNQSAPPELVIVELGGNDMLRGIPPEQTRADLDAILSGLAQRKVKVLVMGMLAAPNLGAEYRAKFDPIFPALARKHGAALVPFFLSGVVGKPELIQADHIHPNGAGVDVLVAGTIAQVTDALGPTPPAQQSPR